VCLDITTFLQVLTTEQWQSTLTNKPDGKLSAIDHTPNEIVRRIVAMLFVSAGFSPSGISDMTLEELE
jgi:hypothetical protein